MSPLPIRTLGAVSILAILASTPPAGAGEVKAGAIVMAPIRVAPVHRRTFQDILDGLVPPTPDQVTGIIVQLDGMTMTLRRKDGTLATINFETAARSPELPPIGTGKAVLATGRLDRDGILHAQSIIRQ